LAAGETKIESFSFNIEDGQAVSLVLNGFGGSVERTVEVTITGTNDALIVAAADVTGAVLESITPTIALTDSGAIAFTDVDLADVHSISAVTSTDTLGVLTASVSTDTTGTGLGGIVTWDYSVAAAAVEYLEEGETKTESFSFDVLDDHGASVTRTVEVNISGTNDAPVVDLLDVTGAVTELVTASGNLTDTGTIAFSDVDLLDVHGVGVIVPADIPLGRLTASVSEDTVNGTGGVVTWNYSVAASAVEYLAAGETAVESFSFNLLDNHGASIARTVEVTITGTNDLPVITLEDVLGEVTEMVTPSGSLTDAGTIVFSDADLSDMHGVSIVTPVSSLDVPGIGITAPNGMPLGVLTAGISEDTVDGIGGVMTWNYSVDASAVEYLAAGETKMESFTFDLLDNHGGIVTNTVDVIITGTNDAPVATNSIDELSGAVTEIGFEVIGTPTASGTLSSTDVDTGATAAWSLVGTPSTTYGTMVIDSETGVWIYILDNDLAATQALSQDQSVTQTYVARVTDDQGAVADQSITITITGTDDVAVITGADTASLRESDSILTASGVLIATDVDSVTTFVAQSGVAGNNGYGTFSINAEGLWNYTTNNAHNEFVVNLTYDDSITVVTSDGVERDITVTIIGSNDAPTGSVTISGTPIQGQTLTAANTLGDPDGLGLISYQWSADGVAIDGATDSSYTLTAAELARAVTVAASYVDGNGSLEDVSSSATVVHPVGSTGVTDAGLSVVTTINVTPVDSSTPTLVALELNNGTDAISLVQNAIDGGNIVIPNSMITPLGVFNITGTGNTDGAEHFSLYLDSALAVNGYWVQNADGLLVNLASAPYGGSTVIEGGKIHLSFTIEDGSEFDTGDADGAISTTGLAAQLDLSIIGHPSDVPVGGVFF
jgi:VCBS repeat-containing protein